MGIKPKSILHLLQIILFITLFSCNKISKMYENLDVPLEVTFVAHDVQLNGTSASIMGSIFFPEYSEQISAGAKFLEKYKIDQKIGGSLMIIKDTIVIIPDVLNYVSMKGLKKITIPTSSVKVIDVKPAGIFKMNEAFIIGTTNGDILLGVDPIGTTTTIDAGLPYSYRTLYDKLTKACPNAKATDEVGIKS